jgi:hypothetical protein
MVWDSLLLLVFFSDGVGGCFLDGCDGITPQMARSESMS